jgi:phenylacetate-CoA ligase
MSTVPGKDLREFHQSSGSTGTPVVMAYTKNDLNQWADCMARCLTMAGLQAGDAFQIMPTFGLFNGGFGCYHGCRKADLFCVPASSGNTERQIKLMRDFRVKGFCSVVSYMPRLIEKLDEEPTGDHDIPSLRVGIFGSETFSDEMRRRIEDRLHIDCFDIYGMTETGGIGTTGQDCPAHCGLHVWEDQYITEIINPVTGEPVPDGEYGEVVFTSLTREAMPVLRYRTRDISRIVSREKCACGRTHLRLDRITGRTDDMLIVKGVNVFPSQIETVLLNRGYAANYQIVVDREKHSDRIEVRVEMTPEIFSDELSTVSRREQELVADLKSMLGIYAVVRLVDPKSIERSEGKAVRVIDRRNLYKG